MKMLTAEMLLLIMIGAPSYAFSMEAKEPVTGSGEVVVTSGKENAVPASFLAKITDLYRDGESCPKYRNIMALISRPGADYAKDTLIQAIEIGDDRLFAIALEEIKEPHLLTFQRIRIEVAGDVRAIEGQFEQYIKTPISLLWKVVDAYFFASTDKRTERLKMIGELLKHPFNLNEQQLVFYNRTFLKTYLLHWAALRADTGLSKLLAEAQANPKQKDAQGCTAIEYAAAHSGEFPTYFYMIISQTQDDGASTTRKCARRCAGRLCW